jgi:hypothetical protein
MVMNFNMQDKEKPAAHFMEERHAWIDMKVVGLKEVKGTNDTL